MDIFHVVTLDRDIRSCLGVVLATFRNDKAKIIQSDLHSHANTIKTMKEVILILTDDGITFEI